MTVAASATEVGSLSGVCRRRVTLRERAGREGKSVGRVLSARSSTACAPVNATLRVEPNVLLNVWEIKGHSPEADVSDTLRDVKTCLKALEFSSDNWESARDFLSVHSLVV